MADDLPVPFDARVHRPVALGYSKAATFDAVGWLVGRALVTEARRWLREALDG